MKKKRVTTVAGVVFTAFRGGYLDEKWRATVGDIGILLVPRLNDRWKWSLVRTKGRKRWWGICGNRYRAMVAGVKFARKAA